jgi:hypothetical protein
MPIIYEPHPVSPARKAELRAQGCQIIDAAFAPVGYMPDRQGTPVRPDIDQMTRKQLMDALSAYGADVPPRALVADLRGMLRSVVA